MSHDPRTLPIETLLADAGWVRALARRLVRDPSAADDLAQDALVAAWRHPPRAETNARSWLARVLRNLVRQRQRSESARGRREQGRARPGAHDDDVLERAELAQRLAQHVLALEEPYRTIVLQRFFDGRSAEEIAERMRVPSSTVRTRLERALARLRETLERENGREWLAIIAPLAHGVPAGSTIAGITGGIAMGTGTKLALGACAAALAGWILWPHAEPLAPALEPPPLSAHTPERVEVPERTEAPADARQELAGPVAPAPPQPSAALYVFPAKLAPGTIEGVVVRRYKEDQLPIAGADVELVPESDSGTVPLARARSQEDGSFRFTRLSPGKYVLRARVGRGPQREAWASVTDEEPTPPVRIAFGSSRLHGHVYDTQGAPLAGIPMRIEGGGERSFAVRCATQTAADGSYALEELPAGRFYATVTSDRHGAWPARTWYLTLVDGDDVELDVGSPRGAPRWSGHVRAGNGELVKSGGTLHLERTLVSRLHSEAKTYREELFDASARFDVALEAADWQASVSLESNPESRLSFGALAMPQQDLERDIVLPGTRVRGTVFDSVTLRPLTGYAGILQVSVHKAGENFPSALRTVQLDAQAHFAIDMLGEGDWELRTFPLLVAAGGNRLAFTLGPGETEKQLDVQVEKP